VEPSTSSRSSSRLAQAKRPPVVPQVVAAKASLSRCAETHLALPYSGREKRGSNACTPLSSRSMAPGRPCSQRASDFPLVVQPHALHALREFHFSARGKRLRLKPSTPTEVGVGTGTVEEGEGKEMHTKSYRGMKRGGEGAEIGGSRREGRGAKLTNWPASPKIHLVAGAFHKKRPGLNGQVSTGPRAQPAVVRK